MKNQYYLLRHGLSVPNERNIVVSHLKNGTNEKYGLSPVGRSLAIVKMRIIRDSGNVPPKMCIYSSPFSRCTQTAQIAKEIFAVSDDIVVSHCLRERSFGDLEWYPAAVYKEVWQLDETDPEHTEFQVESVQKVAERMINFVHELESRHEGRNIVLCSHADPLQILEAMFGGVPLGRHRTLPYPEQAVLKRLQQKTT